MRRFILAVGVVVFSPLAHGHNDGQAIFVSFQQTYCQAESLPNLFASGPNEQTGSGTLGEAKKSCLAAKSFEDLKKKLKALGDACIKNENAVPPQAQSLSREKIVSQCTQGGNFLDQKIEPYYKGAQSIICNCKANAPPATGSVP